MKLNDWKEDARRYENTDKAIMKKIQEKKKRERAILKLMDSGYYHLRINGEIWAQWPRSQGDPTPADCFHEDTYQEINEAWQHMSKCPACNGTEKKEKP